MVSSQTTLSGGYFRDPEKKAHWTVYHDWKLSYLSPGGIETFVNMGVDNRLVQDEWGFYPYVFFVSIPLSKSGGATPSHVSRIQVGRQLLAEGFVLALMDGVNLPYYVSPYFGIRAFGGGLHNPENIEQAFEDQLYGASVFAQVLGWRAKVGSVHKTHIDENRELSYAAISKTFSSWPLTPSFIAKQEWDLKKQTTEQEVAELSLNIANLDGAIYYAHREPDTVLFPSRSLFYKSFAKSRQKGLGTSLVWTLADWMTISATTEETSFESSSGPSRGHLFETSIIWLWSNSEFAPGYATLESSGGRLENYSLRYRAGLTDSMDYILEGNATRMEKINKISGWAYHGRSGFNFNLGRRWLALILAEIEQNHIFEYEARATIYARHFFY